MGFQDFGLPTFPRMADARLQPLLGSRLAVAAPHRLRMRGLACPDVLHVLSP
jgi:hypothetical protein